MAVVKVLAATLLVVTIVNVESVMNSHQMATHVEVSDKSILPILSVDVEISAVLFSIGS